MAMTDRRYVGMTLDAVRQAAPVSPVNTGQDYGDIQVYRVDDVEEWLTVDRGTVVQQFAFGRNAILYAEQLHNGTIPRSVSHASDAGSIGNPGRPAHSSEPQS